MTQLQDFKIPRRQRIRCVRRRKARVAKLEFKEQVNDTNRREDIIIHVFINGWEGREVIFHKNAAGISQRSGWKLYLTHESHTAANNIHAPSFIFILGEQVFIRQSASKRGEMGWTLLSDTNYITVCKHCKLITSIMLTSSLKGALLSIVHERCLDFFYVQYSWLKSNKKNIHKRN